MKKRTTFKDENGGKSTYSSKPLIDMSEEEQRRIIDETGILHKISDKDKGNQLEPPKTDHAFIAAIISIPLCTLFALLDVMVHQQFDMKWTFSENAPRYPLIFIMLGALVYYTNKSKHLRTIQIILTILSTTCGYYLIFYTAVDQTFGNMKRTPGLAVLWIYCVIQLDLMLAVISLVPPLLYYYYSQGKRSRNNILY